MTPIDSDSDNDNTALQPPPKPTRRSRDDLSGNQVLPSRTRDPTARKASDKQASIDKENMLTTEQALIKAQKKLKSLKKKMAQLAPDDDEDSGHANNDDGPESEDELSDSLAFVSPITSLGKLPSGPPRPKAVFRKTSKALATQPAKISSRVFMRLPELNADQRNAGTPPASAPKDPRDGAGAAPMEVDDDEVGPRDPSQDHFVESSSLSPLNLPHNRHRTSSAASSKRSHPPLESLPPPPKRSKAKEPQPKEPKFREGFVIVPGAKPAAGDYEPLVEAVLLRSMSEYMARVIAINGFPGTALQLQWANECFANACLSGKTSYILTARMAKLITKRGSHIRGKVKDGLRALFDSNYGFQRSASPKVIAANKKKSELLVKDARVHYKDTLARTGYGANPILANARYHTVFRDKHALGIIWRSYLDPLPGPYLALDFSILEFLAKEWSTGTHILGAFTEKAMGAAYLTHLADVQNWCAYNPTVTENIRRKWYNKAAQGFLNAAPSEQRTHIDADQEDALRAELEGRTGETESEPEAEADDVDGE